MKQAKYRISRNEFLSFYEKINSYEDVKSIIKHYKKEYHDAKQICWAVVFNSNNEQIELYDDDKEPHGSAGIQILNQMKMANVQNMIVIVVRYFGGIKLGKKGLCEAYKIATKKILDLYE